MNAGGLFVMGLGLAGTRGRRFTGPVALQLALHCQPGHRHRARLDHATHCHVVSLAGDATRGVGHNVNLIALAQGLDRRHGQADLGPKSSHNHLLSSGLLTASTTRLSSQVLMKVRLIGFCSGKTSCSPLIRKPPRSSTTVVRMVGTPNTLAVLARPMTLFTTIVGS